MPVTDSLLDYLAQQFRSPSWKKLGKELGLSEVALNGLTNQSGLQNDPRKARAMLLLWKKNNKGNATEEALKDALKKAKLHGLGKTFEGKHSDDAVCTDTCIL